MEIEVWKYEGWMEMLLWMTKNRVPMSNNKEGLGCSSDLNNVEE